MNRDVIETKAEQAYDQFLQSDDVVKLLRRFPEPMWPMPWKALVRDAFFAGMAVGILMAKETINEGPDA